MKSFPLTSRRSLFVAVARQSLRPPRLELSIAALFCATVAAILTVDARRQAVAPFDEPIIDAIQRQNAPYLQYPVDFVNALTNSFWAVLLWGVVLLALLATRWILPALAVAAMPLGGFVNNVIGVYLVVRTRPDADQVARTVGEWDAPSYPSGHVMGAVMLYGFLLYLSPRISSRLARAVVICVSCAVIASVGFARLWVGAHWPSDVLAAYALGALVVLLLVMALDQFERTARYFARQRLIPDWLCPPSHDLA